MLPVLLLSTSSAAQELPNTLEFSFSNPGARSLGFGGAFVALADDATAAFANPAGLVQLSRPEVSLEGRHWSYSSPHTEGGRLSGQPTGIGLDDTAGLRTARVATDLSALSFLSYVYPKEKWALAIYRHQLANFEQFTDTQGLFADQGDFPNPPPRLLDLRTRAELGIVNYGGAVAFRLSEAVSAGLGLSYMEADFQLDSSLYAVEDPTLERSLFGPNPYLPQRRVVSGLIDSESSDWTVTLGVLAQLTSRLTGAAFYRQGANFEIRSDVTTGPALEPLLPDGSVIEVDFSTFPSPDVWGLGLAYKASAAFTVSFEWDRIGYSDIFENDDLRRLSDGDELHLGAEWVFLRATPIVGVRAGLWLDPDHRLRTLSSQLVDQALFRGGDDELHYAVGIGVALERFQVDLGADFSSIVDRVALSAIYNF